MSVEVEYASGSARCAPSARTEADAQKSRPTAPSAGYHRVTYSDARVALGSDFARDDLDQFKMQSNQFKMVMQVYVRHAPDMDLPEFLSAGECFATPDFFRNVSEFDRVYLGCLNDAAKPLFQIVDFDDVAWCITAVTVFAVRLVIFRYRVGSDSLPTIHDSARKAVVVIVSTPKGQPLSSVHLASLRISASLVGRLQAALMSRSDQSSPQRRYIFELSSRAD